MPQDQAVKNAIVEAGPLTSVLAQIQSPIGVARRRKSALERRGGRSTCRDRGHSRDDLPWDSFLGGCAFLDDLHVYGRRCGAENVLAHCRRHFRCS